MNATCMGLRMRYLVVETFYKIFFFFAKDVIISIFHHCEIRICYLGRSRLSFTRTSMK